MPNALCVRIIALYQMTLMYADGKKGLRVMSRQHEIRVRVTEEEYKNIKLNADILDMPIATYIRMVAQNPHITIFDYSAIRNHTKQIGQVTNSINRLIFTIHLNNDYLPKEIWGIRDYIEEIWETENKPLRTVRKQWEKASKLGRK